MPKLETIPEALRIAKEFLPIGEVMIEERLDFRRDPMSHVLPDWEVKWFVHILTNEYKWERVGVIFGITAQSRLNENAVDMFKISLTQLLRNYSDKVAELSGHNNLIDAYKRLLEATRNESG